MDDNADWPDQIADRLNKLEKLVDMMDAAVHLTFKEADKNNIELLRRIGKAEEDITYLEVNMAKVEDAISKLKRGLAEAESGFEFDPHN